MSETCGVPLEGIEAQQYEPGWGPLSALPGNPLIWVLIASELAVFGLALLGYAGARARDPLGFAVAQDSLDRLAGTINTVILLTSGLFAALANAAAQAGLRGRARIFLGVASALGIAFLTVKGFEYAAEFAAGADIDSHPFFTLYFLITGFHALHVVLGLIVLAIVAKSAAPAAVETGTAFWHMVDLIWVLVFPCLYLLR
ncbi:MAG: cytochrome c oxidase subunit 3 [Bradyrhizobium sp.]|nr:cytochrome c oxidase subunit 3 [Bradyrhizobium sp.]